MEVKKSAELFERAKKVIPGGVNSEIRGPGWGLVPGVYPLFIKNGKGSKIYDEDGNEFIDYRLAYGPVILGHSHPRVNEAVREQLERGTCFGSNHEQECELAEKIVKAVPCAEMVRFLSTGSEATNAAVRIARAYTGKNKIAIMDWAYHGTDDWSAVGVSGGTGANYLKTLVRWGIPEYVLDDIIILPWNDATTVEKVMKRLGHEVAAIFLEPTTAEIQPVEGFLESLSEITKRYDSLLMFDEVKTGFRLSFGGAQEYFNVTPDIATFSKAMGNGFPIAAIAGKREIMDPIATQAALAGTFNSNPLVVAASLATLNELEAGNKQAYKRLFAMGSKLLKSMRDAIEDMKIEAIVQGHEPMFRPLFTNLEKIANSQGLRSINGYPNKNRNDVFCKELLKKGIFCHPSHLWYISTAHSQEDVDKTCEAFETAFRECKKAV